MTTERTDKPSRDAHEAGAVPAEGTKLSGKRGGHREWVRGGKAAVLQEAIRFKREAVGNDTEGREKAES